MSIKQEGLQSAYVGDLSLDDWGTRKNPDQWKEPFLKKFGQAIIRGASQLLLQTKVGKAIEASDNNDQVAL